MIRLRLNSRFRHRPTTGVERFAAEVAAQIPQIPGATLAETSPGRPLPGLKGHAWEQFVLPRAVGRDEWLLSLCNTGPVSVERQLVVVHDAAVWDHPEGFNRSFRTVYQQLLPRLARRARVVATVSEFSRRQLAPRLGLPEERILVLGNAAGPAFCPGDATTRAATGGTTFLCVGSMDPRKNLPRLLRAWLALSDSGQLPGDARLRLVGGANPRSFADVERIEGAGIEWLGRVDDAALIRHYREADAFVYPSYYEGFGLPPLEAMACGCPVLLSHAASLPEVGGPEEDGAALYFDPFSEGAIAGTIARFLDAPPETRDATRKKALARAARFSWERIAASVADALAERD